MPTRHSGVQSGSCRPLAQLQVLAACIAFRVGFALPLLDSQRLPFPGAPGRQPFASAFPCPSPGAPPAWTVTSAPFQGPCSSRLPLRCTLHSTFLEHTPKDALPSFLTGKSPILPSKRGLNVVVSEGEMRGETELLW